MLKDNISYVIKHLKRRKLRSWLTLLGIFIGMAAVVSLISLSEGLEAAIGDQFSSIGADRIMVGSAGAIAGPFSAGLAAAKLTQDDVDVIRKVKGVEFSTGMLSKTTQVIFKKEAAQGFIIGMETDVETTKNIEKVGLWDLGSGRNPKPGAPYEVAIGSTVAENSFDKEVQLRNKIEIMDKEFTVVGIGKGTGTMSDSGIRIPRDTAYDLFEITDEEVSAIVVKTFAGFSAIDVAEDIKHDLRRSRNQKEGEEDFTVETADEVIGSFLQILGVVQALIVGVAAISLVVGGVGISNTMYTAVVERTREIGIMKAIGAKKNTILTIFLFESGFLGITGGAIGAALGFLISKVVEIAAGAALGQDLIRAYVTWQLVAGVLVFSFIFGILAGYFPARKAATMQPVEALRH